MRNVISKMMRALNDCTTEEQYAVIRFLWAKDVNQKIFTKKSFVNGDKCLSHKVVYIWVEKFSQCRSKILDEDRSGLLVLIATKSMLQVEEFIQAHRRVTIHSITRAIR